MLAILIGSLFAANIGPSASAAPRSSPQPGIDRNADIPQPPSLSCVSSAPGDFEACVEAAEGGDVEAQVLLAQKYEQGTGIPANEAEAVRWWHEAAEQGSMEGEFQWGHALFSGRTVKRDPNGAVLWLRRSASKGHSGASYLLGLAHEDGSGVPQSAVQAVLRYEAVVNRVPFLESTVDEFHRVAADIRVQPEAAFRLGLMNHRGEGIPKDLAQGTRHLLKAAEYNHLPSQALVGMAYASGVGVSQDYISGHMWLNIAAARGNDQARKLRDELAARMTPEQLAAAQRLATDWKSKELPMNRTLSR